MSQEAADAEPSMEEILASIKRIINEDDEPEAAEAEAAPSEPEPTPEPEPVAEVVAEPEPEPAPEPEPEPEPEVLELTEKVEEDSSGTNPIAMDDDLMIVDRDEDEVIPAPEPMPEREPVVEAAPDPEPEPAAAAPEPRPAPEPVIDEESLLDQSAATAAAGAFGALADNLRIAGTDGQTLEAIVRELMRPMLKDWLDANLPRIVEQKVEAEIERVARRR